MNLRTSTLALLAANAIPLVGVALLDWSAFSVLALYWLETAIIGVFTLLKIATCRANAIQKLFLMPFFCVHFGGFMVVHGVFVTLIGTSGFGSPFAAVGTLVRTVVFDAPSGRIAPART